MPPALRATLLAVLLLCLAVPAGAGEDPFERQPRLLAAGRIGRVLDTSRRIEAMLAEIHPESTVRDPLQSWIGPALGNPGLRGLAPQAFLEALWFDQDSGRAGPVFAFPAESMAEVRAALGARPGVREETLSDEVIAFRRDGESTIHFASAPNGSIALLGADAEMLRMARELYLAAGAEGVLPARRSEISLRLRPARALAAGRGTAQEALARASRDLGSAFSPDPASSAPPAWTRATERAAANLLELGRGLETLDLGLSLDDGPSFVAVLTPDAGSPFGRALEAAPSAASTLDLRTPGIAGMRRFALWPALWRPLLEEGGEYLAAAAGGLPDEELRSHLRRTLDAIESAEPSETAGILWPPPAGSRLPPVLVRVLRWNRPERWPDAAELLASTFRPDGPLGRALVMRGIQLEAETTAPAEGAPGRLRLTLRLKRAGALPFLPSGETRKEILYAWKGDCLALVEGEPPAAGAPADLRQIALESTLAALPASGEARLGAGEIRPGPYLLSAFALRPAADGAADPGKEFAGALPPDLPAAFWTCDRENARLVFRLRIPAATAIPLAKALLGISGP